MICPHCGENNPDNAKYCSRCSATLPKRSGSSKSSGSGVDIKTVIIIILVILLAIGGIVFITSKIVGGDSTKETEEETETETEEKTEEETEETTEETTEESSEEKTDWAEENGLSVEMTDKTSFKFNTMKFKSEDENEDEDDEDDEEDTEENNDEEEEEFEVSAKLTISETTDNAPDGYKLVQAVFVDDVSGSDGDSGVLADGAFDRYTGTYFAFENGKPTQEGDEKASMDGFVRITDGDDHYDIAIMSEIDVNGSNIKKTITVICPKDYDGTVFFAGYSSKELDDELKAIDFSEKLYTYDELPFMDDGHDTYYFSYQKTDSSGRSCWDEYEVQEEEPVQEESSDAKPSGPPQ